MVMDNAIITDNMKEAKSVTFKITVFCYLLSVVYPLGAYFVAKGKFSNADILKAFLVFFIVGSYALYLTLGAIKYKLVVTSDKLIIKNLIKTYNIKLCDIERFEFKLSKRTGLWVFCLYVKRTEGGARKKYNKYFVWTRYFEKFIEVINNSKCNS